MTYRSADLSETLKEINYILNPNFEDGVVTTKWSVYSLTEAVTFQDTGDTVTLTAHGLQNNETVSFTSIVSTTGITANTLYYVISATTNTFQLAATSGGSAIALTTNGSGNMVRGRPVTGTGGGTSLTLSASTTDPLRGAHSYLISKGASNLMGHGVSIDFTIDNADKASVLQNLFKYTVTTNYSGTNGDVTVWIYRIDSTARLIQPSVFKLDGGGSTLAYTHRGEWQADSDATNYRLILHVSTPNTLAWDLKIDDVRVSPSKNVAGSIITPWQSYTPTLTGFGSATSIEVQSCREGDKLLLKGKFTSGTPTAVEARVSLGVFGVSGNVTSSSTDKIPSIQTCGWAIRSGSGAAVDYCLIEPNVGYITFGRQDAGNAALTKQNANGLVGAGVAYSFFASIPIAGWGATATLGQDADTRVCAAYYRMSVNFAASTTQQINYDQRLYDTHGAVTTGSGWIFRAPLAGIYNVSVGAYANAIDGQVKLYKNGSLTHTLQSWTTATYTQGKQQIELVAGDTLQVRPTVSATMTADTAAGYPNYIAIERISGPSQIAASEQVNAGIEIAANQSITNATDTAVNFDTKLYDSHGAYNTTSKLYTAPIQGVFRFAGYLGYANNTTGTRWVSYKKNGGSTIYVATVNAPTGTNTSRVPFSFEVRLLAGETIAIWCYHDAGASLNVLGSSGPSLLNITKVG